MFIRRTKTRTTGSGEHYYSYRLVTTYRVGGRVRQCTLLNLGSSIGGEAVALSTLLQVKLDDQFAALGFNRKQISVAIGNIIGRMVQPGSELSTHQWLQEQSALGELLDCDYGQRSLSSLYRASDLLWKHHDAIESFLYQQHCALFDVEETITLFDLTNTFF